MANIAKHVRIFNLNPDDDFVTKRTTAISSIETQIKKIKANNEVLKLANALLDAFEKNEKKNETINILSAAALEKGSASFVADDENIQMLVCTVLATIQYLEKTKIIDGNFSPEVILALSLWNGLSFSSPLNEKEKLESLRAELRTVCEKITLDISKSSRIRKITPFKYTTPQSLEEIAASIQTSIEALKINSILDREELDILWWVLNGWSRVAKQQLSSLTSLQASIVGSLEIADLLAGLPAEAFSHMACKFGDKNAMYNGTTLIAGLGEIKALIASHIDDNNLIPNYPKIFPLYTLITNLPPPEGFETERSLLDWSGRMLTETYLLNLNTPVS